MCHKERASECDIYIHNMNRYINNMYYGVIQRWPKLKERLTDQILASKTRFHVIILMKKSKTSAEVSAAAAFLSTFYTFIYVLQSLMFNNNC